MKNLIFLFIFSLIFIGSHAMAQDLDYDSDSDGISDHHEITKYFTDPQNPDTDRDGYDDGYEILNWYSPLHKNLKYSQVDSDRDGLTDDVEIMFRTNILLADTDNDGYPDKLELENGYNPRSPKKELLPKKIVISTKEQKLKYLMDGVQMGEFDVSTGRNDSTPKGEFEIGKKIRRAWSRSAKLWMPYWMPFDRHLYGIHELPEWPNGTKEGEGHLGQPVSGGCVRLGVGAAKFLYEWTPEGTKVVIN